jgi:hypothetical protein
MDLVYPYLPILQKVLEQAVKVQAAAVLAAVPVQAQDQVVQEAAQDPEAEVDPEAAQAQDLEAEVELIYLTQKHKALLVEQLESQDATLVVDHTLADTGTLQFTMQTVIM